MKAISAIGIGLAIAGILMSAMMEGTQIPAFINIPAALLVFGGTLGVTMAGTSMEQMKLVPKLYKLAFSPPDRTILEIELEAMAARHAKGVAPFEKAGGFAPTLGITGTVMGLIHVLENLSQPATLGPAISGAFIATLYGVGSANVIFLPVANKLKYLASLEQELGYLTIEGILAIQAGDNPRVVESKLLSYVAPEERASDAAEAASQSGVAEPAAAAA
jgi:chemotaxis protein MotA